MNKAIKCVHLANVIAVVSVIVGATEMVLRIGLRRTSARSVAEMEEQ